MALATDNRADLQVGVVGAGRMGSGIAHAFLIAGNQVVLVDAADDAIDRARSELTRLVTATHARGGLEESVGAVLDRLRLSGSRDDLATAQLVVEAVPEIPELKRQVLQSTEQVLNDDAILATNTSSLSVTDLSAVLTRPSRFLGMHFFNPVPASSLVEIVRGGQTDESTVATAVAWTHHLAKQPIVVADSPGFASSRLGLALGLEAIRMVESGVASASDIDLAMTLGYKHPIGPLRLTDMVGLDVRLDIATYLHSHLGPRFEPPALLREMVGRNELGRKTGKGFFDWSDA